MKKDEIHEITTTNRIIKDRPFELESFLQNWMQQHY